MILYNKTFTLTADAIISTEYVPAEGTLIFLDVSKVEGLQEHLYQKGFIGKKRVIKDLYIHIDGECDNFASLCIEHTNGKIEVVPRQWFELEAHDTDCLDPELLKAWEQFVPYKVS